MAVSVENLAKVKALNGWAHGCETLHDRFQRAIADPNTDKHGCGFGVDDRFSLFSTSINFSAYTGRYGSSSCGTFGGFGAGSAELRPYLVRALNEHQRAIFASMARLMRADAAKLAEKARAEVEALQAMLDQLTDEQAQQVQP